MTNQRHQRHRSARNGLAAVAALTLLSAGCGGDGDGGITTPDDVDRANPAEVAEAYAIGKWTCTSEGLRLWTAMTRPDRADSDSEGQRFWESTCEEDSGRIEAVVPDADDEEADDGEQSFEVIEVGGDVGGNVRVSPGPDGTYWVTDADI